jgi:hypothetical protein
VNSANAIISIFDLFCRTFGIGYCVLSLSYSVYTATSIFLLQMQTSIDDGQAHRRLEYCVRMLDQIRHINPVISDALSMITRELDNLGIESTAMGVSGAKILPPQSNFGVPATQPADASFFVPPESDFSPDILHFPFTDAFETGDLPFDPAIFEAMSSIEPLSTTVGTAS